MPTQQIGQSSGVSETPVFYVAPPGEVPNVFASFLSNFLSIHTPWALEQKRRELAASDPARREEMLLAWERLNLDRQKAMASAVQAAQRDKTNVAIAAAQMGFGLEKAAAGFRLQDAQARREANEKMSTPQSNRGRDILGKMEGVLTKWGAALRKGDTDAAEKAGNSLEGTILNEVQDLPLTERVAVMRSLAESASREGVGRENVDTLMSGLTAEESLSGRPMFPPEERALILQPLPAVPTPEGPDIGRALGTSEAIRQVLGGPGGDPTNIFTPTQRLTQTLTSGAPADQDALAAIDAAAALPRGVDRFVEGGEVVGADDIAQRFNIDPGKASAIVEAAAAAGIPDPMWLAEIVSFESGGTFDPAKWGKADSQGRRPRGLIQFRPSTAADLGYTQEQLGGMTFEEQMLGPVVEYYKRVAPGGVSNRLDTMMAVFHPAGMGKAPDESLGLSQEAQDNNFGINTPGGYLGLVDAHLGDPEVLRRRPEERPEPAPEPDTLGILPEEEVPIPEAPPAPIVKAAQDAAAAVPPGLMPEPAATVVQRAPGAARAAGGAVKAGAERVAKFLQAVDETKKPEVVKQLQEAGEKSAAAVERGREPIAKQGHRTRQAILDFLVGGEEPPPEEDGVAETPADTGVTDEELFLEELRRKREQELGALMGGAPSVR
jgi:hypothetical protein